VLARLIASLVCAIIVWQLLRLSRESQVRTSGALWLPFFWLFIASSRNVSDWLHVSSSGGQERYLEGNPLDRALLSLVIGIAVIVLIQRGPKAFTLIRASYPVIIYFAYCGISFLWSDYPDVSFKRWFRALGDLVMVLVVLTDRDALGSFRRLFTRLGIVLMTVSILFIRYFPDLGRTYSEGGTPAWCGVATDKNALGMLCMVFGLPAVFRFLQLYTQREGPRQKKLLIAQGSIVAMAVYLIFEAHSATAMSCFYMAGGVMALTFLFRWARKPAIMHAMVFTVLGAAVSALFLGIGSGMVQDLGRDSTLTGRTNIWKAALPLVPSPVVGAGFESFWIGPRLQQVEISIGQEINEAHNGYIEIYLNLGWVGVALLMFILLNGYSRISSAVRRQTQMGSLRLAYFIVAVAYDFSEAGFKMESIVWFCLLLSCAVTSRMQVFRDPTDPKKPAAGTPQIGRASSDRPETPTPAYSRA
jgi:exopolysaccharide production protein ExoQ